MHGEQKLGGKVQKSTETEQSRRIAASPTLKNGSHLYTLWRPVHEVPRHRPIHGGIREVMSEAS